MDLCPTMCKNPGMFTSLKIFLLQIQLKYHLVFPIGDFSLKLSLGESHIGIAFTP